MKKMIAGMAMGMLIGGGAMMTAGAHASTDTPDSKHGVDIPAWVLRSCKTEDSVNCRWNAHTQGNGQGHTFIVRQFPGKTHMICVMYAEKRYAKTHDYCD